MNETSQLAAAIPALGIPADVHAEQALLGSIMRRNDVITSISAIIRPESFYKPSHAHIYTHMLELVNQAKTIDEVTLGDSLREKNLLEECGNYAYLSQLFDTSPYSGNTAEYARIIQGHFMARRLMQVSLEVSRKSRDPTADIGELIGETEKKLAEISVLSSDTKPYEGIKSVLLSGLERLKKISESDGSLTGLETGFTQLNQITSGLQRSDLIILAARPSMGKTALALNIARKSIQKGGACLFCSLEMSGEQLGMRLLSAEANIDSNAIRQGSLQGDDWERLGVAYEELSQIQMYFNDTPRLSTFELLAAARGLHKDLEGGLSLLVVDYLQLMTSSTVSDSQNQEQKIADISRTLKGLAKELNIPVIALAQLNRAVEGRTNKRPMMSDLRESGALEQDADIVMLIYRDEVYNPDSKDAGTAELIISKHRNGATGMVRLAFIGKYTKFANFSSLEEPEPGIIR